MIKQLKPCEGEQYAFEEWAKREGLDMTEHPLHYLFLDPKTATARYAWSAALDYARKAIEDEAK